MLSDQTIRRLRELPTERVAERLGLTVSRHKALCPFHHDSHPSLMFRRGRNSYHCFVCGASGSGPIDLVMQLLHKSFPEACQWLADEHNVILPASRRFPHARACCPVVSGEATIDLIHLEQLTAVSTLIPEARKFLFEERKISPSVVRQAGLSSIDRPMPMSRNLNGG